MPSVYYVNKYKSNNGIYIGRPSKYGNPFSHLENSAAEFKVSSRREAIKKYIEWLTDQPDLLEEIKTELKGKDLLCWCAPLRCHGDYLLEIANNSQ